MAGQSPKDGDGTRVWTLEDARETYGVSEWGRDYFAINERGNLTVSYGNGHVDLKLLVDDLVKRGIPQPLLLRFSDLLQARIALLNHAFETAIKEYGYRSSYQGVYPIKVNQSRTVVESIVAFGRRYRFGLEAGSKPELLAVMAVLEDPEALVICNGYKDDEYVETALLASRLGRRVIMVVEKPSELVLIKRAAEKLGVFPRIGIRMRLSSRGSGKWEKSVGDHAKFGLSAAEILELVAALRQWDMLDSLQLLHFHMGSQITAIRSIKAALREAGRMYAELVKLGCDNLSYFDVGGGLGVDYDGSQTNFASSMNYSVQEYANDVVYGVMDICDSEQLPHPILVSESGRAVVAHHSVLVVDVIGVTSQPDAQGLTAPSDDDPEVLHNIWEVHDTITRKNYRECFHDIVDYKEQALSLFNLGHLSLQQRAYSERLFWSGCRRIRDVTRSLSRVPEELTRLDRMLSDTYFCNFSMFQSLPDSWAIDQLFPIMPIHRLQERPTRRGVLADITCDSDGKIDAFINAREVKDTLELHPFDGEPYYLAIMLTGAYQEILGDLHNLFGDTHVVHVQFDERGGYQIEEVLAGNTVTEVLRYVNYQPEALVRQLRGHIESAVRRGEMSLEESRLLMSHYRRALDGYTYLSNGDDFLKP